MERYGNYGRRIRFLAVVFPLVLISLLAFSSASSAETDWYLDGYTLVITGTGSMEDFTEGEEAPWGTDIEYVDISEGVTDIGDFAFRGCTSLVSIDIPDTVTEIGNGSFKGCTSLAAVSLPENLALIGQDSFRGCTSLTEAVIPATVEDIGAYAFAEDSALARLNLGHSLRTVRMNTFMRCTSLESVVIPDSVDGIEAYAFSNCTSLKTVTLGKGTGVIGAHAFRGCISLKEVVNDGPLSVWKGTTANGSIGMHADTVYTYSGEIVFDDGTGYLAHYVTVDDDGSIGYYNLDLEEVAWSDLVFSTGYTDPAAMSRMSLMPPETPVRAVPVTAPMAASDEGQEDGESMLMLAGIAILAFAMLGAAFAIRRRF